MKDKGKNWVTAKIFYKPNKQLNIKGKRNI